MSDENRTENRNEKQDKYISVKNHFKVAGKVVYCYFLSLLFSWAGFPIISIFTLRNNYDGVSKNVFLPDALAESKFFYFENINAIFTGIATVVLTVILYLSMHEIGENDRKPYKWSKYRMKGFTTALIAAAMIIIVEIFVIWIADRYIVVEHPQWNIHSLHNYVTMILYAPFYWFYHFTETQNIVMPAVTYLTSLYVAVPLVLTSGFGYFMGYTGRKIIKNAPKSKLIRRIIYGKNSKNWKE